MGSPRTSIVSAVSLFRGCWRTLALTDVAAKAIAFVLLTPLLAILFRAVLAMSGRTVLADQDILLFLLEPAGLLIAVLFGGLLLAIVAMEQAALMAVLYADRAGRRIDAAAAIRFAVAHAWAVLRVAARMVGVTLLAAAPFVAVLAVTYSTLLGGYDINYYLKERPPVFLLALGIGGVVAAALAGVLLRLFTGWFFALPLVLFEDVPPAARSRSAATARAVIGRRSSRGSRDGRWRWRRCRRRPPRQPSGWLAHSCRGRRIRPACSRWRSASLSSSGRW